MDQGVFFYWNFYPADKDFCLTYFNRPLFDENNGRSFQSISENRIRNQEIKSGDNGRGQARMVLILKDC